MRLVRSSDPDEVIDLFQALVNANLAWQLQGHYARTALRMISDGLIERPDVDDDGNVIEPDWEDAYTETY